MSISLSIEWPSGERESIPIVGQRTASSIWRELGIDLGLEWVPHMHEWIPITPDNLEDVYKEMTIFRDAVSKRVEELPGTFEAANDLINGLAKLRQKSGWTASIG